jgi:hypothetical protein
VRALRALIDRLQPSRVRVCVGAALRRERVAKQPQQCVNKRRFLRWFANLGLLRSPFATQGRSYNQGSYQL